MERRYTPGVLETREVGEGLALVGHAAIFDAPYEIWDFTETVARGAFKKTLKEADVAALWNHDPNVVLGRNRAGTLVLSEDDEGLRYEIDLPDTQAARDLHHLVERGDVYQSSFAFEIVKEDWDYPEKGEEGRPTRTIREVRLFDVSPVTYPASPSTDVDVKHAVRSLAAAMGVEDEADSVSELLARRDSESTVEPETEPETHSDTTQEPEPYIYIAI